MRKIFFSLITVTALVAVSCERKEVEVTGVKLSTTTVELVENETQSLTASIEPADASDQTLTWSSSDESIATVDQSGKITAVSPGAATITVTSVNGKSVSCKVTVNAKEVAVGSVSIDKTELTLIEEETGELTTSITPADATDKTLNWSSSNESIATVDQSGKVTAVAPGTTTIIVTTNNGKIATCTVTVVVPVAGIEIENGDNHIKASMSESKVVTATISPSNASDKNITWSVDNPTILQLSNMTNTTCSIKGLKEGYATLKATTQDGNIVDECVVSVHNGVSSAYFKSDLEIPTRKISAGSFKMGSPDSDTAADYDEKPQHNVTLTNNFYMSKFEVTNYQFAEFLNAKNISSSGYYNEIMLVYDSSMGVQYNSTTGKWQAAAGQEHYPVICVTWDGASGFANWVGGRLPTEAEWEYSCRAGTTTPYYWGSTTTNTGYFAWYNNNSDTTTHPVGEKQPNEWGLYDMAGNVWEWCSDWYGQAYTATAQTNPKGPATGASRVMRGGDFDNNPSVFRSASRSWTLPNSQSYDLGFRVVFDN